MRTVFIHVKSWAHICTYKTCTGAHINVGYYDRIYCILCGGIKGFNRTITTMLFEVGSYRPVVG